MSKALIIGSVAIDSVESPHGKVERALGGSASFASVSASYFTEVSLVGVVGEDFTQEYMEPLEKRGIDLTGIEKAKGKTFHWSGYYLRDMAQAYTNTTELNVFADFSPKLTAEQRKTPFVFLANIHPEIQLDVLSQMENPQMVALDTMNLWIESEKSKLTEVIKQVDLLLVNDGEAQQYCEKVNLIECGRELLALGPKTVVLKKGEHGALLFQDDRVVYFPAFPLENVKDPTGAGDTFAGGLIGYLARLGEVNGDNLIRGVHLGSCMASFVVEDFSLGRLMRIEPGELASRADTIHEMVRLPDIDPMTLEDFQKVRL